MERTEGSADLLAIVREAVAGAYNEWKMISEAVTEIMEAHERIVGELRAENAKLSEDLNRLSIIRARLNLRLDFALDKISKLESRWPHGESPEERFEHYISNTIDRAPEPLRRLGNWLSHVLDEDQWTTAERMLTGACVAAEERAAAQTHHSVPEGWKPVPIEPLLNMMSDKDHDTRIMAERQLLSILADAPGKEVPQAWLDVQAERRRQVEAEGWTPKHDDEHADGQMAQAAGCYALHAGGIGTDWPDGRQMALHCSGLGTKIRGSRPPHAAIWSRPAPWRWPRSSAWTEQRRLREGQAMRRALTALGIIAALGLAVVGLAEIFPILRTLAAWQTGCH